MKWIDIEEVDEYELPKDQELSLLGDVYSGLISIGKYFKEENEFELMAMEPIEPDSHVTHFIRIPKLPKREE